MFSVGLDEFENLILYHQLIAPLLGTSQRQEAKIVNNKPFILLPLQGHKQRSKEVNEIIFGSLLGDAQIELPPRGLNARFGFTQSINKKEYFLSVLNSLG